MSSGRVSSVFIEFERSDLDSTSTREYHDQVIALKNQIIEDVDRRSKIIDCPCDDNLVLNKGKKLLECSKELYGALMPFSSILSQDVCCILKKLEVCLQSISAHDSNLLPEPEVCDNTSSPKTHNLSKPVECTASTVSNRSRVNSSNRDVKKHVMFHKVYGRSFDPSEFSMKQIMNGFCYATLCSTCNKLWVIKVYNDNLEENIKASKNSHSCVHHHKCSGDGREVKTTHKKNFLVSRKVITENNGGTTLESYLKKLDSILNKIQDTKKRKITMITMDDEDD
ncbi:tRNA uridine 5-carboxymethylaminomethyl modification enzyme [Acrasis kona]|uniref:tRNA uridine 5-carboxymethylaminomethyl modification enzyme n=1 Tax=Acrasis kona TaxID=1008807 RepID=A0AAW2ZPM6_9EUKA